MHDIPRLGASLYVPCTHPNLSNIAQGQDLSSVRSIIFCTEDSVAQQDLASALQNLTCALTQLIPSIGRYRFIRVRNLAVLKQVLLMPGINNIDGFVLPKVTAKALTEYMELICTHTVDKWVMPTLETVEVFSDVAMQELLQLMLNSPWRYAILSMRIGGNDLLSLLKIRRRQGQTIYDTPLAHVIARLVCLFVPHGFSLSAPVFERLDDMDTLSREIDLDLSHGLQGKTAIHPLQVQFIEQHYQVRPSDMLAAQKILDPNAPGVFKLNGAMCEPATHESWAQSVLYSAKYFGIKDLDVMD